MVRILTFRDPVSIDDPSQCCVNQAGPHQPWPLSRFAESLSKKRPERKGALHQGVRLAGAMARRGTWRKATHRTVHSTLRDTRKLCRHRLGSGRVGSGREHGDAVDPRTRKGSRRSEHNTCRQSFPFASSENALPTGVENRPGVADSAFTRQAGSGRPEQVPERGPVPPSPSDVAVVMNVSAASSSPIRSLRSPSPFILQIIDPAMRW